MDLNVKDIVARRNFSGLKSPCFGVRILLKQETWRRSFNVGLQFSLRLCGLAAMSLRVLKAVRVRHKPASCVPCHYVKLIGSIKLS